MNTTQLLASLKRRAYVPTAGTQLDDTALLSILDEATTEKVLRMVLNAREGFMRRTLTIPLVAGQSAYALPGNATGGTVLWVRYVDPNNPGNTWPVPHCDEVDLVYYPTQSFGFGCVWYFDGGQLQLVPPPAASQGNLIVAYTARPNQLTAVANTLTVVAVTGTYQVKLSANGATIGLTTGVKADIIQTDGVHDWRMVNKTATVVADTATFTSWDQTPQAGDYVCLTGYTPVPQLPDETHSFLALEGARRFASAINSPKTPGLTAEVAQLQSEIADMLSPRAVKQSKRVINRVGAFRSRRGLGNWNW